METWTLASLMRYGEQWLSGGVSSTARINPFTGLPIYLSKAQGSHIYDITGKRYIDYFMGHGACLLGHDNADIKRAIIKGLDRGWSAEFDCELNIELARRLTEIIPSAQKVRYTSSGTESTTLCMRLARAYTGKEKIVRIDGHFHGTNDYVLTNWLADSVDMDNIGNRVSRFNPVSRGIPQAIRETMIIVPWNNLAVLADLIAAEGDTIAGIMMVPIDYNNGCITTNSDYLRQVNELAHAHDIVVIYDEILSGFRTGLSCGQGYYGVTPDLCALGKVLSNGVPLGVVVGSDEVMEIIMDETLPVASGGTYSGNLLGVVAALATLDILSTKTFYPNLFRVADHYFDGLKRLFAAKGISASVQHLGSNFFIYFGVDREITDYRDFATLDRDYTLRFYRACIKRSLYFHTDFTVSAAHSIEDIDETLNIMETIVN